MNTFNFTLDLKMNYFGLKYVIVIFYYFFMSYLIVTRWENAYQNV